METEGSTEKIRSITDLFKNYEFINVSACQHGFVWEEENWKSIFKDLVACNGNRFYLGQFVFEKGVETPFVIDGQQRLTVTLLILSAMVKILSSRGEEVQTTMSDFLSGVFRPKSEDQKFFENITLKHLMPAYENAATKSQKLMIKAFRYFIEELDKLDTVSLKKIQASLEHAALKLNVVSDKMEAIEFLNNLYCKGRDGFDRSCGPKFETVKYFLLHQVYLKSTEKDQPQDEISEILDIIASIYRSLEIIEEDLAEDEVFECYMSLFYPQLRFRRLFENFTERFLAVKNEPDWIKDFFQNYRDLLTLKTSTQYLRTNNRIS